MNTPVKILIADDHPIFRRGLRHCIEEDAKFSVIGEAENGIEALRLIAALNPDAVLADIDMPEMNGLDLARVVREKYPSLPVVILTMHKDKAMFDAALAAGARGYVLKENAANDINECLKMVAGGGHYIAPSLSGFLLSRAARVSDFSAATPSLKILTRTERRVLRLVAEDKTSREIGDLLFIHPRTVDSHRRNICQKLNLHGSHALLRFALTHKSELGE
ncbi:MAG: response regulator transcription factor [Pyrinomonadaceae bacterium]|nr:response regulator transcription factor [Pyrinomonadaceae bacterium]